MSNIRDLHTMGNGNDRGSRRGQSPGNDTAGGNRSLYAGGASSGIAIDQTPDHMITITAYTNGFQIADGPFRPFTDPANVEVFAGIKRREAPQELAKYAGPNGELAVALRSVEGEYSGEGATASPAQSSPPTLFQGAGHSLSGAPATTAPADASKKDQDKTAKEKDASPTSSGGENPQFNPKASLAPPNGDDSDMGTVVIRFHNGKRHRLQASPRNTVRDLRDFVRETAPGPYRIFTGFPLKEIPASDDDQLLSEAGLINNTVTQQL